MEALHKFGIVLRQNRARWLLAIVALFLVVDTAVWRDIHAGKNSGTPGVQQTETPKAQTVSTPIVSVAPAMAPQWLEATGTVQPELESALAAKVMGRVQSVLVREGDSVRKGQPLVFLDARDLEASIAQSNANLRAADVGYDNARVAAHMERALSAARIANAKARLAQSQAALKAANAKLDLVLAGPRRQERAQAALSVAQAQSSLILAESNLHRMTELYDEGAIPAQQYDQYKSQYEVAKAQYAAAQQAQSMTDEGSRAEEIRAAQEAVRQAQAAVQEARAGWQQAQASALQIDVRRQEIQGAQAQIGQAQASLQIARVTRGYAVLLSPFDGVVTQRLVDPGAMASPGVPLLKVQGGARRLEAVVPETALAAVRQGASVPVRLDALGSRERTGRVVEIAPQGDAGSHTFVVKIVLPKDSGASSGMFGRARFRIGTERRLLVPQSAVWEREGLHYLYIVDASDTARLRMVTVGEPAGNRLPVLSGLNPGERIVAGGRERLADGARVTAEGK
ncbi:MAG TPA: efflux RND transporter periplasmic adaptor subunit [Chthonomonadaceae bacterium]|nr:efflux RND transporter periplasmic adaptor subunit [Chthonomonadaceae bacterium]